MAMEVESGSVVSFKTRDLWDAPRTEGDMVGGWDMTASGNAANTPAVEDNFNNGVYGDLGTVHILTVLWANLLDSPRFCREDSRSFVHARQLLDLSVNIAGIDDVEDAIF